MTTSTEQRVAMIVSELMEGIRATVVNHKVTYDEYTAAKQFVISLGKAGEWPLFADVFFESAVEQVASEGRDSSDGAIAGPYYIPGAPELERPYVMPMRDAEPGDVLIFSGCVHSAGGGPLAGAVVDLWQSDTNGTYSNIPYPDLRELPPDFNLRGRLRTDDEGRFEVRTVIPVPYEIPKAGPTGALLRAAGWHAFRPAHLHCTVSAAGHEPLTTQLYFQGDPYLDSDVARAVKPGLVLTLEKHSDPEEIEARGLATPFYTTAYQFRLA